MTAEPQSRTEDVQEILLNAIEVQLAAFTAGIGFWSVWVEQARKFSEETIRLMGEMQAQPSETSRILLELTDVSRASLRAMADMPRTTAEGFIEALDSFEGSRSTPAARPQSRPSVKSAAKKGAGKKRPNKKAASKKVARKSAKRRVRAKP
jgi:hypothetical protein